MTRLSSAIFRFLAIATALLPACSLRPFAWQPPAPPAFAAETALNEKLAAASRIELGDWQGPEDFAVDAAGNMYCGVHGPGKDFSPGAILKIFPDGSFEEFVRTDSWVTGLDFDREGNLIALVHGLGLVRIDREKRMEVLVTHDSAGNPILMGSGLAVASDGKTYFANLSSEGRTSTRYINRLLLEWKPTGGVYCFDPETGVTRTLSAGNYFANGLELSAGEDYLLLSETSRYRVLKYWLKGEKAGTWEVLMDNLPGFPNNISRRENGNFWLGFTTKRNAQLDKIHPKKGMKKLVYGLPTFLWPKAEKFGMVMEISGEGKIIRALFDPSGESVPEAGAVLEWQNELYIGGDVVPFIARYPLEE